MTGPRIQVPQITAPIVQPQAGGLDLGSMVALLRMSGLVGGGNQQPKPQGQQQPGQQVAPVTGAPNGTPPLSVTDPAVVNSTSHLDFGPLYQQMLSSLAPVGRSAVANMPSPQPYKGVTAGAPPIGQSNVINSQSTNGLGNLGSIAAIAGK